MGKKFREILKQILKECILGYREVQILASLWKVERIDNFTPYPSYRLYGKSSYIEIAKIDGKWVVMG